MAAAAGAAGAVTAGTATTMAGTAAATATSAPRPLDPRPLGHPTGHPMARHHPLAHARPTAMMVRFQLVCHPAVAASVLWCSWPLPGTLPQPCRRCLGLPMFAC